MPVPAEWFAVPAKPKVLQGVEAGCRVAAVDESDWQVSHEVGPRENDVSHMRRILSYVHDDDLTERGDVSNEAVNARPHVDVTFGIRGVNAGRHQQILMEIVSGGDAARVVAIAQAGIWR